MSQSVITIVIYVILVMAVIGGIGAVAYATYIRVSETIDDAIAPRDHHLTYINHSGVFYKYKIEGLEVKKDPVRYYAIIQLLRPFISGIDAPAQYDNTINAVPYSVSKQYKFSTINGTTSVSCVDIETVLITDKFVGYVRYINDPFFMVGTACDSHFVAFSCDHEIDDLLEADVEYYTQLVTLEKVNWLTDYILGGYTFVYNPENPEDGRDPTVVTLTEDQQGTFDAKGLFTGKQHYEWKRISSTADFLANVEQSSVYEAGFWKVSTETHLTEEGRAAIANKQWVLQFVETPFQDATTVGSTAHTYKRTKVCNVSILRLMFRHNGIVYNLGVVDNMQTEGDKPVTETTFEVEIDTENGWWKALIAIILLIVLLIILWPVVPYIAKFLIWLITLPFKLIGSIAKAGNSDDAKERRNERKRRRQERKEQRTVNKLKYDLQSGKKKWSDLSEAEENAMLGDEEYVNSLFENDNWNGED